MNTFIVISYKNSVKLNKLRNQFLGTVININSLASLCLNRYQFPVCKYFKFSKLHFIHAVYFFKCLALYTNIYFSLYLCH